MRHPDKLTMPYSQNNEEAVLLGYFGTRIGRFLDIGANDGETLSNTRALALLGWSGVWVEPSPVAYQKLSSLYPNGHIINAAVGLGSGEVEFYEGADTLTSTLLDKETERWGKSNFSVTKVRSITPAELFDLAPGPYDFISIDCEGMDVEVLANTPSTLRKTAAFCIEHNAVEDRKSRILSLLPDHKTILSNAENLILVPN